MGKLRWFELMCGLFGHHWVNLPRENLDMCLNCMVYRRTP
jgi:hypothetical protein